MLNLPRKFILENLKQYIIILKLCDIKCFKSNSKNLKVVHVILWCKLSNA